MHILAIETSCDETGVAICEYDPSSGIRIHSNQLASQIQLHARFGGVVPEIASREHARALPPMADLALQEAELEWSNIDAIAVTSGPGLMGALLVGTSFARAAAAIHQIPAWPIHHLEAHVLAAGLQGPLPTKPMITLLVSGGHTLLVRVDGIGRYKLLGQTLDDAAGECFDKSARLLGLSYPGGPQISQLARKGKPGRFRLPRPMLNRNNLDFSFSGLKTAVLHARAKLDEQDPQGRADLAAEIESAICEVLVRKAIDACRRENVHHLMLAGGVAANRRLRELAHIQAQTHGIHCHMPDPAYCTDNAAMVAHAACLRFHAGIPFPRSDAWDADPRQAWL